MGLGGGGDQSLINYVHTDLILAKNNLHKTVVS